MIDPSVSTQELADELKKSKPTVIKWAEPLEEYGWIVSKGEGIANEYRPGFEPSPKNSALPSIIDMANAFPELAEGICGTDPLTGRLWKSGRRANEEEAEEPLIPLNLRTEEVEDSI
jgi:hypothetical protein